MRSTISWSKALRWVRKGRAAAPAVDQLEHGRLDLDVALLVEHPADRPQGRSLGAHHVAGLLAHDEVGVALANPALLGQLLVQHRKRAKGLARHLPAAGHHRQLTAPGADDPTLDEHVVAEVDVRLPVGQGLFADLGQAQHDLQARADPLLERRESELAGVADEDHAAGDADDVLGLLALLEVAPLLADLGQRVRARHGDGVRVLSGGEQTVALVAADPHLLGQVDLGEGGGRALGHDPQAYGPPSVSPPSLPRVRSVVWVVGASVAGCRPLAARGPKGFQLAASSERAMPSCRHPTSGP
jgi:hypothetical protein